MTTVDNPDHALVSAFILAPDKPLAMGSSPFLISLDARLTRFDPLVKELEMTFSPDGRYRQGAGQLQGGIVSAILDFASAFCAMTQIGPDQSVTTTTLHTSFFGASPDLLLTARARIERAGRRMVFTTAVLLASDRPIASAASALLVI